MFWFEQQFRRKIWKSFIKNIFYFAFFTQMNFENVDSYDSNDFKSNAALKVEMQKCFQKFKNQMKKIINTHKKEFDNTMIEINSRINEVLNIIKNKKTIIVFKNRAIEILKKKLIDKSKNSMKSKKNTFAIKSNVENDVVYIITKKQSKWLFYRIQTSSLKKINFELMIERWKLKANCRKTSVFFRSKTSESNMCKIWLMIKFCVVWNFGFVKSLKIRTLSSKILSKTCVACTTISIVVSLSSINFAIWKWKK